jgi:CHAT domain-containing protein/tetratricopeptide (TPR) repeat protein
MNTKPPLTRVLLTGWLILVVLVLPSSASSQLIEAGAKTPMQADESASVFAEASATHKLEVRCDSRDAASGAYEAEIGQAQATTEQDRNRLAVQAVFAEAEQLRAQGDLESLQNAIKKYQEALSLYRSLGNHDGEANALSKLAEVCFNTGENKGALDYSSQELLLRRTAGDRRGEAHALLYLGLVYNDLGQKQQALDYFNQALLLCRTVGDRVEEPNVLNNIGWVYSSMREPKKALDHFNQALSLSRSLVNRETEARALLGIGGAYTYLGENQKALDFENQALSINRAIGARREEAYTLLDLAWLYVGLGQKQKALDRNQDALLLMRDIGERKGEAMVLHGIGWIYELSGGRQKAIDYYNQALPLRRAAGDIVGEADTLYRLALCKRDSGNSGDARADIADAVNIIESLRSKIGNQELRDNYIAFTAQDYYEFYIDLLSQLHQINPSQGYDAAALQISERARARSLIELLNEARADIRQGVDAELLERERSLQQSITAATAKRIRLLNIRHTIEQGTRATQELEGLTSAYQEVEAKIRTDNPRYAALTQPQPLTLSEIQQLLDADTLLLEFALGKVHSHLWVVTPTSINSFELAKASVVRDAARHLYELLTARTKKVAGETRVQRDARITKSDAESHTAAAELSRMLLSPVASQLGKKRLVIVSDGVLQYIPFAALPVPEPLGDAAKLGGQINRRIEDRPLILEHEIVNLPSVSTLALLRRDLGERKPPTKTIAVFADPVFEVTDERVIRGSKSADSLSKRPGNTARSNARVENAGRDDKTLNAIRDYLVRTRIIEEGQPLARLPYSRKEALAIASLVPKAKQSILLDFDVNYREATNTELGDYRFLHFATHGLLDTQHPELSGILLSLVDREGKPQANGILRLGDIYNLRMPVDMVSLSACETALGKFIRGEGLVGLTRGFMYAGAPRVMASLWKVDEEATADLIESFYEGVLGEQQLRPAAALRQAQIEMWRRPNRRAPFYWSAFVMQGEWK